MKILFVFLFALTFNVVRSQQLSEASERVKIAFNKLKSDSSSVKNKMAYLNIFPKNKKQFMDIFQPENFGQLYPESNKYIEMFIGLAKHFPDKVIDKSVDIGADLKWEADATGQMQNSIVDLGNEHIDVFSKKLNSLPKVKRDQLITFLADAENHKAYHTYEQLIKSLQKVNENNLAIQFIRARKLREKNNHH